MEIGAIGPNMMRNDIVKMDLPLAKTNINDAGSENAPKFSPLKEFYSGVNQMQNQAEQTSVDFSLGKVDNLHRVVVDMQEAMLSLKMAVQVRNKAVEAYQEMMRMQV